MFFVVWLLGLVGWLMLVACLVVWLPLVSWLSSSPVSLYDVLVILRCGMLV